PGVAEVQKADRNSFIVKMEDGTEREFVMFKVGGHEREGAFTMWSQKAAAYEGLHRELLEHAGKEWAADRINVAETLKDLAKELKKRGEQARAQQRRFRDV